MKAKLPIGISDFRELCTGQYDFVDKTDFIRQFIDNHSKVTLITRPRRFGKTLNMSMLDYFFSIQHKESSENLFDNLAISQADTFYMQERGQYPVLFFSLKNFSMDSWEDMLDGWRDFLKKLFLSYNYLKRDKKIETALFDDFDSIIAKKANATTMSNALSLLISLMRQYYDKPVVVLIDEYDAPIQQAWSKGYYEPCITFMRQFLSSALKDNKDLNFAVLTGVLRISKESIFSGLNNLDVCTVLSNAYADAFGFTPEEVAKMANDLRMADALPDIQRWYDGYHFGSQEIYNPWSVVNFFRYQELADYWVNTSGNSIMQKVLQQMTEDREQALLALLHGNTITTAIREGVIYADIERDDDTLFTLLLTTGYLTAVSKRRGISGLLAELAIPNKEVRDVFRSEIIDRVKSGLSAAHLEKMLRDLMTGKADAFSDKLATYLRYYVSSFDTAGKEVFYHALLLGMTALMVPEYSVESNRESGHGRFDIGIFPKDQKKAGVILEFKLSNNDHHLEIKAREALEQIEERQYETEFKKRGITHIWKYGIAFCGKKVCVLRK